MKKILTSIALFGLLAAGCSNADNIPEYNPDDSNMAPDGASGYMAISIVTPRDAGSRATYEDGQGYENKVENIRFFFFKDDTDKSPALVKKNPNTSTEEKAEYYSYYDYKVEGNEEGSADSDQDNVEKVVNVTIALNGPKEEEPKYVIAVLNPNDAVKNLAGNPTMADLRNAVSNYQPEKTTSGYKSFLMSNSVYKDTTGKAVDYSEVKKLYRTLDEALESFKKGESTIIYVERVAARLDLYIDESSSKIQKASANGYNGTGDYVYYTNQTYKEYNAGADATGKKIYVKFLGWAVISTPNKSNLLKNIDESWDDKMFGGTPVEPWNSTERFRSFWGINPTLTDAKNSTTTGKENPKTDSTTDYQFFSYDKIKSTNTTFGTAVNNYVTTYMQENAAQGKGKGFECTLANHETKVIVAAELVDENGTAMPVAEWGFKYYQKDDLLTVFADQLQFTSESGGQGSPIKAEDLEYKTQYQYIDNAGVEVPGGYFSYVVLKDASKTWYLGDKSYTASQVNTYIQSTIDNRLLIWENGQTYYYFTIRHIAPELTKADATDEDKQAQPGYYGVVRNHIYRAGITELTGLGTPVLDKDETIYPEKPDRDGHIIAAEIRVLSWRVVSQGYEFSW